MYESIYSAIADLESIQIDIARSFEKSRELSMVLTKLDEARMWLKNVSQ